MDNGDAFLSRSAKSLFCALVQGGYDSTGGFLSIAGLTKSHKFLASVNGQWMIPIRLPLGVVLEKMDRKDSNWKCNLCDYSTYHKARCRDHLISKHADRDNLQCPHCNDILPNVVTVKSHLYKCNKSTRSVWLKLLDPPAEALDQPNLSEQQ